MSTRVLEREELFHDQWADSIDVETLMVDECFESCTTPEMRQIMSWLGDIKGKNIIDLGCGAGEAAVYFAKKGAHATAVDLSPGMLEVVKKLAAKHGVTVETTKSSADRIPFEDNTFDILYAGNLLHHVDIESTLSEVRRVLKPHGVSVFWDPLHHNPLINIYRKLAANVRTEDEHPIRFEQLEIFKKHFTNMKYECFWFATLWIFIRFYLIERVAPNKERYWKKIVKEHKRLEPSYNFLDSIDRVLLRCFPILKRYCWNIAIYCEKKQNDPHTMSW